MAEQIEILRRALTEPVINTITDIERKHWEGRLVLQFKAGNVKSIETREVKQVDRRDR
jgi:hypothetical protein